MAKLRYSVFGVCALLLLPLNVAAQIIGVVPGPDEEGNYVFDYGEVAAGASANMIFGIWNRSTTLDLIIEDSYLQDGTDSFEITDQPSLPTVVPPFSDYVIVEVTFNPGAEGLHEDVMRIVSNASNVPPDGIPYTLEGTGVAEQTPADMMDAVIDFYDYAKAEYLLYGGYRGKSTNQDRPDIFREMLVDVHSLIEVYDQEACRELSKVMVRVDGVESPPDLISGFLDEVFYGKLTQVFVALECG